jgi:hypothetical protein
MQGLERFIETCMETWPDQPLRFDIVPSVGGGPTLQVSIGYWLSPVVFKAADLRDPRHMIRSIKASMTDWVPMHS